MRRETLAAIAGLALIHATVASAQIPAVCAKDFVKSPAVATGIEYGVRESAGQRWCEGTFITPVGATQLTVEHFTQPFVPVDTSARRIESLNVEWHAPADAKVVVSSYQTERIPHKQFYEFDLEAATGHDGKGTFSWPTKVLRDVRVFPVSIQGPSGSGSAPELKTYAKLVKPGEASPIYVPLRITRPGDAPETRRRYELVFFVPERVTVDSVQVTPEAGPKGSVVDQGACRARSGGTSSKDPLHITICMPPTAAAGVYSIVIFTKPAQAPIRFYHAPLQ